MKWLFQKGCPIDSHEIFSEAARHGSLENIKWLFRKGCPIDSHEIFSEAARHGSLENIKWLYENGCPVVDREHAAGIAERRGHYEAARWIRTLNDS